MKLSLAWIFGHISANLKDVDVRGLIDQFSATSAEVDDVDHIKIDLANFYIAKIKSINTNSVTVECPELKKNVDLPLRKDVELESFYLIKKDNGNFHWVSLMDLGSSKEGLLINISCDNSQLKSEWKKNFENEDYIITIDNKAFTHRPDLWGHRGVAREIAAIINKKLLPEEQLFASKTIKHYTDIAQASGNNPITLEISKNTECANICKRLAGLYIENVENRPSSLKIATRLARVDSRPLNFIVDATNYVMFDIGQPMHAFDAEAISGNKIIGRCAHDGEELELLDGEVTLTDQDYLIADEKKALALAGIMGGKQSAVSKNSHSLFIEAANFEASAIRRTSFRVKKRTEASARFEKSLDPNQNTQALLRYLKLFDEFQINYKAADFIASIGQLSQEKIIVISQLLIDKKIGAHVTSDNISRILLNLGFGVKMDSTKEPIIYTVTVPTFRAIKDVTLPEDIIEEIARFVGYSNIMPQAPVRQMLPFNIKNIMQLREIKQHLAYGMKMQETETYAFFDEEFLNILKYDPVDALRIANPLSEHWQRLITSLIPNILKCVYTNSAKYESLRFFEINDVWFYENMPVESRECAGIFYERKKSVDFYHCKQELNSLFELLKLEIDWVKPEIELEPWYNIYQTAQLKYKDRIIGVAGKISQQFINNLFEGDAFIFELDANFLSNIELPVHQFETLMKYPEVNLDISMLVPLTVISSEIEKIIKKVDKRIKQVKLLDFYQKDDWKDQKSVTYRFVIYDENKTLTKEEIDSVWNMVVKEMQTLGAAIR